MEFRGTYMCGEPGAVEDMGMKQEPSERRGAVRLRQEPGRERGRNNDKRYILLS